MTARVERYVEQTNKWISHNVFYEGKKVKGVVPNFAGEFEATMLPQGQGFTTVIDGITQIIDLQQPAIEYWIPLFGAKNKHTKFRLIPT